MSETTPNKFSLALRILLFSGIGIIVLLTSSSFIVSENENSIVLRLGKPIRTITKSGWYFRLPTPIDKVKTIDTRLQLSEIRTSETLTKDKRNVIIPIFFTWRVDDPLKFINNVESTPEANTKLDSMITSARNSLLGNHNFSNLVSTDPNEKKLDSIEKSILKLTSSEAQNQLGIKLVSVGITQIKLPKSNTESVFRRMRAERKREAATYRAQGKSEAEKIKATANKQNAEIITKARKYAQEIRGKAEAEAATIYATAHSEDVDFYRFLRSLQSLRAVVDKNTTLVLDTNSPPFDILNLKQNQNIIPQTKPEYLEATSKSTPTIPFHLLQRNRDLPDSQNTKSNHR